MSNNYSKEKLSEKSGNSFLKDALFYIAIWFAKTGAGEYAINRIADYFIRKTDEILEISDEELVDKRALEMIKSLSWLIPKKQRSDLIPSLEKIVKTNHPGYDYFKKILKTVNSEYKKKLINNLVVRGFLLNQHKRDKAIKNGTAVPFTVLISPTMRCNLQCIGCYASSYSKKDDMPINVFDDIITQAEQMGVAFFTLLGGEPFLRDDLFKIYKKHDKTSFQAYTNGTLINEKTIEKLLETANVVPMLSIEGFEEQTDERRGKGVYKRITSAMELLKKNGIPFGFSVDVTSKNEPVVASEKFIDEMIERGALFGWYFLSMPIGSNPDLSLMPTPEQRMHLYKFDQFVRSNKPIFIVDFWNDAPYVGGCIAGRSYIHINPQGWVEPCIFTHLAVDNVKDKSLREIMDSEFFREIRAKQPFDNNLLLPCMWIDHPNIIRELYARFKPKETDFGSDVLKRQELKEGLDEYSRKVHEIYEPVWKKDRKSFPGQK